MATALDITPSTLAPSFRTGVGLARALGAGERTGLTERGRQASRGLSLEEQALQQSVEAARTQSRAQAAADVLGGAAGLAAGFLVPGIGWVIAPQVAQVAGGLASGGRARPSGLVTGALGLPGTIGAAQRLARLDAIQRAFESDLAGGVVQGPFSFLPVSQTRGF